MILAAPNGTTQRQLSTCLPPEGYAAPRHSAKNLGRNFMSHPTAFLATNTIMGESVPISSNMRVVYTLPGWIHDTTLLGSDVSIVTPASLD